MTENKPMHLYGVRSILDSFDGYRDVLVIWIRLSPFGHSARPAWGGLI